jgi:uridine monophosphate synthetase
MNNLIIHCFYNFGIVKFGDFTLKDGSKSPYYIDLRLLISYPLLLRVVCEELQKLISQKQLQYDHIAGVPLAGIPIATLVSAGMEVSGLLIRKEPKEYGCKKAVEGFYTSGGKVLLIDDVVTSAVSKRETIAVLNKHELVCEDIVVVVDRRTKIEPDLRIHALLTMPEIVDTLLEYPRLRPEDREKLLEIES